MGIVYFDGYAHLLHLRTPRTMYGSVFVQGKITKYEPENGNTVNPANPVTFNLMLDNLE
jgi:hypothetical protein